MSVYDNISSKYSYPDHYFLFVSIIYVHILYLIIHGWSGEIINLLSTALAPTEFIKIKFSEKYNIIGPFIYSLGTLFFVVESWWAALIDYNYVHRFRNFLLALAQPLLLYLLSYMVIPGKINSLNNLPITVSLFHFLLFFKPY